MSVDPYIKEQFEFMHKQFNKIDKRFDGLEDKIDDFYDEFSEFKEDTETSFSELSDGMEIIMNNAVHKTELAGMTNNASIDP